MGIMILLCFILLCYGLSNMVVYSNGPWHIFSKWRDFTNSISENLGELFSCMMCFPLYAGVLISLLNVLFFKDISFTPMNYILTTGGIFVQIITVIFDGIIASGTTWILHNIEEFFENNGEQH